MNAISLKHAPKKNRMKVDPFLNNTNGSRKTKNLSSWNIMVYVRRQKAQGTKTN